MARKPALAKAGGGLIAAAAICWLATGAFAQEAGGEGAAPSPAGGVPAEGTTPAIPPSLAPAPGSNLLLSAPPMSGVLGGGVGGAGSGLLPGSSLRDQIAGALGLQAPGEVNAPGIIFVPALLLSQEYISDLLGTAGKAPGTFITTINPSLAISANTSRIVGNFVYSPQILIYEGPGASSQDQVVQNFAGNAHVTLVPDELFLDLNAFATEQSVIGGLGPAGTVTLSRNNAAQTYSFAATPYLLHHFGTFGTGELGASVTDTSQQALSSAPVAVPGLPPTFFGNQNMFATSEFAAFVSGDDFGRWLSNAYASFTQYSGTGVFNGAYRDSINYETGYAITRTFTVLGLIGWDYLGYGSIPPVRVNSAAWDVGFHWTPDPQSSILALYGRRDGLNGPYVQAVYAPSPRSRLFARYSLVLSTDQEQISQLLSVASFDASGNAIDLNTGVPLLLANNFFGIQTSVYKLEQGSVGGTLLLDRDTFLVSLNHLRQSPVGAAPGIPAFSQRGTYGQVNWQRDLREDLALIVLAQYGVLTTISGTSAPTSAGAITGSVEQKSNVVVGASTLNWLISPTLTSQLLYSHTLTTYQGRTKDLNTDLVLVSLRKTF